MLRVWWLGGASGGAAVDQSQWPQFQPDGHLSGPYGEKGNGCKGGAEKETPVSKSRRSDLEAKLNKLTNLEAQG